MNATICPNCKEVLLVGGHTPTEEDKPIVKAAKKEYFINTPLQAFSEDMAEKETKDCPYCQWILNVFRPAVIKALGAKNAEEAANIVRPVIQTENGGRLTGQYIWLRVFKEFVNKFAVDIIH